MKKIVLICMSIFIIIFVLTIIIEKDDNTLMMDGVKIALTLDGNEINYFPSGQYHVSIDSSDVKCDYYYDTEGSGFKLSFKDIGNNAKCKLDFTSNPNTLISVVENAATNETASSAGYRYEGANPNNYVWFNDEMWRIIGSIPTKIDSSTTSNLVKIIRNNEIAVTQVNNSANSSVFFGGSKLFTLLNTYYYGKSNNAGDECDVNYSDSKCYFSRIGISKDSNDYYGSMIKNVYWNNGTSTVDKPAATVFSNEKSNQNYQGRVGIMNASDYGYATNYGRANLNAYNTIEYTSSNWLYGLGNEWVMTITTSAQFYIKSEGNIGSTNLTNGKMVRPVVFLDSSVYVVSGDGTEANPYRIGM